MGKIETDEIPVETVTTDGKLFRKEMCIIALSTDLGLALGMKSTANRLG